MILQCRGALSKGKHYCETLEPRTHLSLEINQSDSNHSSNRNRTNHPPLPPHPQFAAKRRSPRKKKKQADRTH